MKGWILSALLVTFMAGMSTGVLVGRETAPEPQVKTWIDAQLEELRKRGVTAEEDLSLARKIYEEYQANVFALKTRVDSLLREQLRSLSDNAQTRVQAIIDSRTGGTPKPR